MILAVLALFAAVGVGMVLSLRALWTTGVPVRTADPAAVQAALELLELRDGETFVDLGAGLGNVLGAARRKANVHAVGYELNPWVAAVAGLRHLADGQVRVHCSDSRRADLGRAQALYAYLMPRAMAELAPVLSRLPAGTRLVSVDFELPGWTPRATREVGPLRQPILLYVLGDRARAAGDEPRQ